MLIPYDLAEQGGVKKHALHLAAELRRRGDTVDLWGPYSKWPQPLPEHTYGFRGVVNIRSNGSENRMGIFNCPWRVARMMRENKYDVLHVHEPSVPSLAYYAVWFAGKAIRVATFHAFSENEKWLSRNSRRLFVRPQLRLFDVGIAVSPAAKKFASWAWPRPVSLIPNGIDTTQYVPPSATSAREPGPLRLLFVGHWRDPRKGLFVLLEAFAALRARQVDVELDVVGDGPVGVMRDDAGVHYHGAISDEKRLSAMYRRADVFVAPSMGMESFGIVLLEAMASGRAIVCSDIEGYRAVVPADGAQLAPPGDAARLTEALARVLADGAGRARMGEVNRRAALPFDWALVTDRVRAEYERALGWPVTSGAAATVPRNGAGHSHAIV